MRLGRKRRIRDEGYLASVGRVEAPHVCRVPWVSAARDGTMYAKDGELERYPSPPVPTLGLSDPGPAHRIAVGEGAVWVCSCGGEFVLRDRQWQVKNGG